MGLFLVISDNMSFRITKNGQYVRLDKVSVMTKKDLPIYYIGIFLLRKRFSKDGTEGYPDTSAGKEISAPHPFLF